MLSTFYGQIDKLTLFTVWQQKKRKKKFLISETFPPKNCEIELFSIDCRYHNKSTEWRIVKKLSHYILDFAMETSKK